MNSNVMRGGGRERERERERERIGPASYSRGAQFESRGLYLLTGLYAISHPHLLVKVLDNCAVNNSWLIPFHIGKDATSDIW
jgi:hypothetical protein